MKHLGFFNSGSTLTPQRQLNKRYLQTLPKTFSTEMCSSTPFPPERNPCLEQPTNCFFFQGSRRCNSRVLYVFPGSVCNQLLLKSCDDHSSSLLHRSVLDGLGRLNNCKELDCFNLTGDWLSPTLAGQDKLQAESCLIISGKKT